MGLTIHYGMTSGHVLRKKPRLWSSGCGSLRSTCLSSRSMTRFGILAPTCANVLSTNCDPTTRSVLDRAGRLQACADPLASQASASITVQPLEIFSFWTVPGPGSEWASFGLARYPAEIEVTYCPRDDDRFIKTIKNGCSTRWEFDWERWERWLQSQRSRPLGVPRRREVPAETEDQDRPRLRLALFEILQDPVCVGAAVGGIPNFIRCHLCVIHLLDRIAELPTMKVEIDDEGKYGRSYYTDDPWAEKRVYTWHEGKYDVKALVEEVGEWNEMLAVTSGAINDMLKASGSPIGLESPISAFPDFEHLEFKGQQNHQHLAPFLQAMKQLAEQQRA